MKDIAILLVVFTVAVVLISACWLLLPEKPLVVFIPRGTRKMGEVVPPPATGNIDDVVDALMKELSDEDSLLKEEDDDAVLAISDSQEISDFGQSIDENEL